MKFKLLLKLLAGIVMLAPYLLQLYNRIKAKEVEELPVMKSASFAPAKPSIGRIFHYVMPDGQHRAGMFTNVEAERTSINLFLTPDDDTSLVPRKNVDIDQDEDQKLPGTWHWPERV